MFGKNKITFIGTAVLEPGMHIVLTGDTKKWLSPKLKLDTDIYTREIFVPHGYRLINFDGGGYATPVRLCYENTEPVRVKVYQKGDQRFCPEFGVPVQKISKK